jgi:hypothetical protein
VGDWNGGFIISMQIRIKNITCNHKGCNRRKYQPKFIINLKAYGYWLAGALELSILKCFRVHLSIKKAPPFGGAVSRTF